MKICAFPGILVRTLTLRASFWTELLLSTHHKLVGVFQRLLRLVLHLTVIHYLLSFQ